MNATWIANTYANKFRVNPYMKLHDIVQTIWLETGIRVSNFIAYRERKKGQALIVGEYEEQYGLLPRYAAEILKSNRANTVKMQLNAKIFQRLDHLGGQLLVAVGRDGNNQMFPIAWAVVKVESIDSWTWFLTLLGEDLGTVQGARYTFISDQQKGLLAAVDAVFPEAEAKSSTENDFNANMDVMRNISADATDDLMNRNYMKLCRAFYSTISCCESMDNNMCKVDEPEHYVNDYFTKTTYLKAYDYLLEPLDGPQEWPRPKVKRRLQQGEVIATGKLRKKGVVVHYSLCGKQGHNKKGCKNVSKGPSHNNDQSNTAQQPVNTQQPQMQSHGAGNNPIPMHMRGVGLYTYPNGYQRIATPVQRAYYRDNGGVNIQCTLSAKMSTHCQASLHKTHGKGKEASQTVAAEVQSLSLTYIIS
ncbi:uncharacterized protein LOC110722895 [Chenopodium quinoa]|uniref:uncharacterized protein LOC110722895 n=1 Tax=Chenopodium quinoa TaxID=63459 RepID=UPI000B7835A1|nr:uncharacterized protein LOC110722895 [Chenopodium quinoa]